MKHTFLCALLALGLMTWASVPCMAEPTDAPVQKTKKSRKEKKAPKGEEDEPAELSPVAAALKKVNYYTESKPALNAKYYLFLFSTSTCFHCNRTMPGDVAIYKEMRRQGDVEMMLVTISQLDNAAAAKGFLNKYGAPFAGAIYEDMKAAGVPGMQNFQLPPGFVIVNCDGQVVHSGPGSVNGRNMMEDWKKYTIGEDAEIPPPSAAEQKAAEKQAKEQEKAEKEKAKAEAKAAKAKEKAEKRNKKKK